MKKVTFTLSVLCLSVLANAQLIKNDFLKDYSIGEDLEKGTYTIENEKGSIQKTWMAMSGNAETSFNTKIIAPLTYNGYVESGKDVAFEVEKLKNGSHTLGYSMVDTPEYNSATYYLATMINVTKEGFNVKNASSIRCLIGFSTRFTLDLTRGILGATTRGAKSGKFRFVVAGRHLDPSNSEATLSSESYDFDKTHLAVLKYDFDAGKVSIFINPKISGTEPRPTAEITMSDADAKGMAKRGLRAISIKQDRYRGYKLGGLRFAKTWAGAVGANTL